MQSGKFLLCAVLLAAGTIHCVLSTGSLYQVISPSSRRSSHTVLGAWHEAQSASLPFVPARLGEPDEISEDSSEMKPSVSEGVPPPLCAGRCASPRAGPVCAFDATGTARTFATLCELEAVSCRESTYYAITSLGEC